MNPAAAVKKATYAGLFMVTLATLMYELLLTRIFSATMWYHFAFVAISVAMFGMTVGAIIVYLRPNKFTQERANHHLTVNALLLAVFAVLSFLTYLCIPFFPDTSVAGLYSITLTYVVISVPFVFSGICVCVALTKFPREISKLYAADLAGAAIGCVMLIYVLKFTDGPTAVIVVGFLAAVGAALFSTHAGSRKLKWASLLCCLLLAFFAGGHTIFVRKQRPLLRLLWVSGKLETRPLYEKWNSFSRIRVIRDVSSAKILWLVIDTTAATRLVAFDGKTSSIASMATGMISVAHNLRRNASVFIVGVGGGKDILSALAFNQRSIVGVEINNEIIRAVNERFGDFTGHLNKNPKVTIVNDEARSYITRSKDQFDIIQIVLIDTWAATAAGAFVLSENSLYTVEAWKVFLEHLAPNGVLTVTRFYFRDSPGEIYRLTSLASASLLQFGVQNPRDHVIVVRTTSAEGPPEARPDGYGTLLVCRKPFSDQDIKTVEDLAPNQEFEVVLTPKFALNDTFAKIASGGDLDQLQAELPMKISAPTDDSPFFFHMLRLRDVFRPERWKQGVVSFNMKAVALLAVLLATVVVLTILCIIVPLLLTAGKVELRGATPLLLFFASIGFGFMLIEISQMQKLIVFLGHPTYGLSVVLFALLLSSGLGSYLTGTVGNPHASRGAIVRLLLLLCVLVVFGIFTPYAIHAFRGSTTALRIAVATGILCPIGLFMGMAFPLGMRIASIQSESLTPWLWGANGATSVCASVLAVVIALHWGISTSFWTGFSCYVVAFLAFLWSSRRTS